MVHVSHIFCTLQQFRNSFQLKNKDVLRWFPGHMGKGIKQMQQKLKTVDCVVEVHDARIPFSGRNPEGFKTISGLRPHVLVYNKRDLADEKLESVVLEEHKAKGLNHVVFTNCKIRDCTGIKKLIPMVHKEILASCRHNRTENQDFCLMVIGVPNVGKSSIINALRNKYLLKCNAAHVGAKPGITRGVGEKIKISDDPLMYVLDTPGILTPKVASVDVGMKLALCATIPDKEVGIGLIADYLLFWLNKHGNFRYVDMFDLKNASDDITEVLAWLAIKRGFMLKVKEVEGNYVLRPNLDLAAMIFVDTFRRGLFGPLTLDIDKLQLPAKQSYVIRKRMDSSKS